LFPKTGIPIPYLKKLPGGLSHNTQPGTLFYYHLKWDAQSDAKIEIADASGREIYAKLTGPAKAGLNVIPWPRRILGVIGDIPIHRPGDYRVALTIDGKEYNRTLHFEDASDDDFLTGLQRTHPENEIYRAPSKR